MSTKTSAGCTSGSGTSWEHGARSDAPAADESESYAVRNREQLSRVYSDETWRLYELLDQSLEPRGPETLYEIAGEYLRPGQKVLDAGCRDAEQLIRLVELYDVTGVGVDPIERHIEKARVAVEAANAAEKIDVLGQRSFRRSTS